MSREDGVDHERRARDLAQDAERANSEQQRRDLRREARREARRIDDPAVRERVERVIDHV